MWHLAHVSDLLPRSRSHECLHKFAHMSCTVLDFNILSCMHNWEFFLKNGLNYTKNYMHRQNFTCTEQILHAFVHVKPRKIEHWSRMRSLFCYLYSLFSSMILFSAKIFVVLLLWWRRLLVTISSVIAFNLLAYCCFVYK